MNEEEISESLAHVGMQFIHIDKTPAMLPVKAAWIVVGCSRDDGRRDIVLDLYDKDFVRTANSSWFSLAHQCGLFDPLDGQFLLGVDLSGGESASIFRWARVKLMDSWDILSDESTAGAFGFSPRSPEFVMMSTSGRVILRGTTWEDSIGFLAVPTPDRVKMIRDYAERLAKNPRSDIHERRSASEWLNRTH
ncbi:hypothetical protein ACWGRF_09015 [Streptomyces zhihengii]